MSADPQINKSAAALAVGYQLLDHLDPSTGIAWPGVQRLAERTGFKSRPVERAIALLIATGWFLKTRQGGTKRGESNRYAFARWNAPSSETGLSDVAPSSMASNPVTNRQVTPSPMTGDSPYESPQDSRQRNLRVFGVLETRARATAPAPKTDPVMDRISAALATLPELENFARRVPRAATIIRTAYEIERDDGEGAGLAVLLDAIASAPALSIARAGGAR